MINVIYNTEENNMNLVIFKTGKREGKNSYK